MPVAPYRGKEPILGKNCFIAPTAWIIGDVTLGDNVSVFFGAVLRGDINPIIVGDKTNIQENAVLHTSRGLGPCVLGREVTIGHGAILHGCTVEDEALIGIGAVVLDNAIVRKRALVGAKSFVPIGKEIPEGMLAHGAPASVKREVSESERAFAVTGVEHYVSTGLWYKEHLTSE